MKKEIIEFINTPEIQNVINLLTYKDHKFMLVGGCVRNLIKGIPITDIDIASNFTPEENILCLQQKNIKTINSGIQYGTITAIINNKLYEITTIRQDIKPSGRKTNISYTNSFLLDSKRRDFTINALYLDHINLTIIDYYNGIKDLLEGNIVFIGSAQDRIKEDNLRILRYFRFYNQFSKKQPTTAMLNVLKKHSILINNLSNYRTSKEFFKILNHTNNLQNTLILMHITKCLKYLCNYYANRLNTISTLINTINYFQWHKQADIIICSTILKNLQLNKIITTKSYIKNINLLINIVKHNKNSNLTINKAYKLLAEYGINSTINAIIIIGVQKKYSISSINNIISTLIQKQNIKYMVTGSNILHLATNKVNIKILINYAKYKQLQQPNLTYTQIIKLVKSYALLHKL